MKDLSTTIRKCKGVRNRKMSKPSKKRGWMYLILPLIVVVIGLLIPPLTPPTIKGHEVGDPSVFIFTFIFLTFLDSILLV